MEIEKSRNGFYTITFINRHHKHEEEIRRDFSTVGNVCKIIQNFQRVFVRFKEKEEAERALKKFAKKYEVDMAKNSNISDIAAVNGSKVSQSSNFNNVNHQKQNKNGEVTKLEPEPPVGLRTTDLSDVCHLILGNLPKTFTAKDVHALVGEVRPLCINPIDETRVFNIKFCHIVLDSKDNLNYLIEKLNGFTICEEKLIAAEAKDLIEWKKLNI